MAASTSRSRGSTESTRLKAATSSGIGDELLRICEVHLGRDQVTSIEPGAKEQKEAQEKHKPSKAALDEGYTLNHLETLALNVPLLETLDLGRLEVRDKDLVPIATVLSKFSALSALRCTPPLSLRFWQAVGERCHNLTRLILLPISNPTGKPEGLPIIGKSIGKQAVTSGQFLCPPNINRLTIKCAVDVSLLRNLPATVTRLNLATNSVTDTGLIAVLQTCKGLRILRVTSHNCDGTRSMPELWSLEPSLGLQQNSSLKELHLIGLQFDAAVVLRALSHPTSPKLTRFTLHAALSAYLLINPVTTVSYTTDMNAALSEFSQQQGTSLLELNTNIIRTDASVQAITPLGTSLRALHILDCVARSSIEQCAPLSFTHHSWCKFLIECPQLETWRIQSTRDTGLCNVAVCLLGSLCLKTLKYIALHLDSSNLGSAERLGINLPPLWSMSQLENLLLSGGGRLGIDDLRALSRPIPADPLQEDATLSLGAQALQASQTQAAPALRALIVTLSVASLRAWGKERLTLPFCDHLHLVLVSDTDASASKSNSILGNCAVEAEEKENPKQQTDYFDGFLLAVAKHDLLPSLRHLTLATSAAHGVSSVPRLEDATLATFSKYVPLMKQLSLIYSMGSGKEEQKLHDTGVTAAALLDIARLEHLQSFTLQPSTLPVDAIDQMKTTRDDVWAAAQNAPEPLLVSIGGHIVTV